MPRQPKLSKNRYFELKYFCLQHQNKKTQLLETAFISGASYEGMPSSGKISNSTADIGVKRAMISKDTELVEYIARTLSKAKEPDSADDAALLYTALMDNITKDVSFEYLVISVSRRKFFYIKQDFFNLLDLKMFAPTAL